MKVIDVLTAKGGTAKTETVKNVAYELGRRGYKVLIIDLDPQANCTSVVLEISKPFDKKAIKEMEIDFELNNEGSSIYGADVLKKYVDKCSVEYDSSYVLLNPKDIRNAIYPTRYENLDIVPASMNLVTTDMQLKARGHGVDEKLKTALGQIRDIYDYVIIDNSPFINAIGLNGINACCNEGDLVIIPVKVDQGGMEGLDATFRQLVESFELDESLEFDFRILPTMVNRNNTDRDIVGLLDNIFPGRTFSTSIRYQGKPVTESSLEKKILLANSRYRDEGVVEDYRNLVDELLQED